MRPRIDLTHQKFTRLYVVGISQKPRYHNKEVIWECHCECGAIVHVPGYLLRRGFRKSCGCMWKSHEEKYVSHLKVILEINSRLNVTRQCQEWTGHIDRKGAGRIHTTRQTTRSVQDISWLIHQGKIPHGMVVKQACGNSLCFRIEHLYLHPIDHKECSKHTPDQHLIHKNASHEEGDVQ